MRDNEMDEALVVKPGFATPDTGKQKAKVAAEEKTQPTALSLFS